MPSEWVDFKVLKETVNMQMILDHYGIKDLRKSGDELRGPCPIHKGRKQEKTFTVNLRKNAFKCFSAQCGARGNVIDFVAAKERCSIREAALKLKEWFNVGESGPAAAKEKEEAAIEVKRGIYRDKSGALFEVIATGASAEDFEPLVLYREIFGDFKYWAAPAINFCSQGDELQFTLIKSLD